MIRKVTGGDFIHLLLDKFIDRLLNENKNINNNINIDSDMKMIQPLKRKKVKNNATQK